MQERTVQVIELSSVFDIGIHGILKFCRPKNAGNKNLICFAEGFIKDGLVLYSKNSKDGFNVSRNKHWMPNWYTEMWFIITNMKYSMCWHLVRTR